MTGISLEILTLRVTASPSVPNADTGTRTNSPSSFMPSSAGAVMVTILESKSAVAVQPSVIPHFIETTFLDAEKGMVWVPPCLKSSVSSRLMSVSSNDIAASVALTSKLCSKSFPSASYTLNIIAPSLSASESLEDGALRLTIFSLLMTAQSHPAGFSVSILATPDMVRSNVVLSSKLSSMTVLLSRIVFPFLSTLNSNGIGLVSSFVQENMAKAAVVTQRMESNRFMILIFEY